MHQPVTIVGSGLAGALLACYLGKEGRTVELYERRPDPRSALQERGRSINLALSTRGLYALSEVGLADLVLQTAIAMPGRMIHHPNGSLTFQPYGKSENEVLYSVSRALLNRLLVEQAANFPGVTMFFEHRCQQVDLSTGRLTFDNGKQVFASVIVGADGAYSAVRQAMQRRERFDFSQEYLEYGYKELEIPADEQGRFRMEKHALHIWPRGGFMLIALPNVDGTFTCTLFAPYVGANSFVEIERQGIRAFFAREFPDAKYLISDLEDQFTSNPVSSLVTIRCHPWNVGGKAVLVGDACHAVVPFLGQGMNAAFEDCSILMECLRNQSSYEIAFSEYTARRKPHLDTLARLCLDNFLEMRDHVGSRWFVLRKKLSLWAYRLLPGWYRPLYVMVEFTRIPYAQAERIARRQSLLFAFLVGMLFLVLMGTMIGLFP